MYSTDSWVNIKASEGDDTAGFLDDINPGLTASGNIFFDVSKGVVPTTAMADETAWDKTLTFSLAKEEPPTSNCPRLVIHASQADSPCPLSVIPSTKIVGHERWRFCPV